jgi:hypothetical protein
MQPYYLTKDISELQEMCEFNEISGYLLPLAVERFLGCLQIILAFDKSVIKSIFSFKNNLAFSSVSNAKK